MARPLQGFQRITDPDPRVRRNAAHMAATFQRSLDPPIHMTDDGLIGLDLADIPGLVISPGGELSALVVAPLSLEAGGITLNFGDGLELNGSDILVVDVQDPIFVDGDGVGLTLKTDPGLQISSGLGILLKTSGSGLLLNGPGLYVDNTVYVPYTGATKDVNLGVYDLAATALSAKADGGEIRYLNPYVPATPSLDAALTFNSGAGLYVLDFGLLGGDILNVRELYCQAFYTNNVLPVGVGTGGAIGGTGNPYSFLNVGEVVIYLGASTCRLYQEATGFLDVVAANGVRYRTGALAATQKTMLTPEGGIAVKLVNRTGAASVKGKLVVADSANNDSVVLTGAGDVECFGVFYEDGIANGSAAWIVVAGIASVRFQDNHGPTAGNWVSTGTAGYAVSSASPTAAPTHFEEIGHCIQTVAAGGPGTFVLARCVLHFN